MQSVYILEKLSCNVRQRECYNCIDYVGYIIIVKVNKVKGFDVRIPSFSLN